MENPITFSNICDLVEREVRDDYKLHSGHNDFTVLVSHHAYKKDTTIELDMGMGSNATTIIKPVQELYTFSAVVIDNGKSFKYEPQFYTFKYGGLYGFKLNPR